MIQSKAMLLKPDRTGRSDRSGREPVLGTVRLGAENGQKQNREKTGRTGPEPGKTGEPAGLAGSAVWQFFS
jgi:hypothetical protein